MIITDPHAIAAPLRAHIEAAGRILILTHVNPDGDAIGSLLAVWHVLQGLGKQAIALAVPPIPGYATWLPGADQVQLYRRGMPLPDVDLVILVDTAAIHRIGPISDDHDARLSGLPLIIIDHHLTNDGSGTLNLIDPGAASNCELLFMLFKALQVPVTPTVATCLLLGMTTDTLSFQTSSTSSRTLQIAAALLEHGAEHQRVVTEVYYTVPYETALLVGQALAGLQSDGRIAWTTITRTMMDSTGAPEEGVDEAIKMLQRVASVRVLVMFKERIDGTTKLSLRSRPPINVAAFAQRWGGGGHAQAAGINLAMPLEQAQAEILPALRELLG
jgi:phosphoesterase RecJ-like protein